MQPVFLASPAAVTAATSRPHTCPLLPRPPTAPPCSAAAADVPVLTEVPKDGSAVRDIMVPEWAGMSYDAQYDDIFSKPLNLRKVRPRGRLPRCFIGRRGLSRRTVWPADAAESTAIAAAQP